MSYFKFHITRSSSCDYFCSEMVAILDSDKGVQEPEIGS